MNIRIFLVFLYLQDKIMPLKQIEYYLNTSDRTIRKWINEINERQDDYGCFIKLVRGLGYRLMITDKEQFEQYVLLEKQDPFMLLECHLLQELLEKPFIKLDDFCAKYYVSKGSVKKSIQRLKEILKFYHIAILSRPYLGLYLSGKEAEIRKLILDLRLFLNTEYNDNVLKEILDSYEIRHSKSEFDYLLRIVNIIIKRNQNGLKLGITDRTSIHSKAFDIADDILKNVPFPVEYRDKELTYLAEIIDILFIYPDQALLDKVKSDVHSFRKNVKQRYQCDLFIDNDLFQQFLWHVACLYKRLASNFQFCYLIVNPSEIEYSFAYELTIEFAEYVLKDYQVSFGEIEMLFYYFKIFLENDEIILDKPIKIGVIFPKQVAFSEFFLHQLKSELPNDDICPFLSYQYDAIRAFDPDLIFSLENFKLDHYPVIFAPQPFLSINSHNFEIRIATLRKENFYHKEKLKFILGKKICAYLSKDLFFYKASFTDSEKAIDFLDKTFHSLNITDCFKINIEKRLKLGRVHKTVGISVLACYDPKARSSKVGYMSLQNAIEFDKLLKSRIIIPLVYNNDEDKKLMLLFIGALFQEIETVLQIYELKTIDELIHYILYYIDTSSEQFKIN